VATSVLVEAGRHGFAQTHRVVDRRPGSARPAAAAATGEFRAPVVVAQHIPASFTGPLARRLNALCSLRVHEVDRIMTLRRGDVYLGKGSADVVRSASTSYAPST
jgi:hypothetical protein